jgi:type II secretory pathway component PulM
MQYKTIAMELIGQRSQLHEKLKRERKLLSTMETIARELKTSHEAISQDLAMEQPQMEASLISSQAMEMALTEMEARMPPVSPKGDGDELSLDQIMATLSNPLSRG